MWLWTKISVSHIIEPFKDFHTNKFILKNVKYIEKLRNDGMHVLYNKRDENVNNERKLMWKAYFENKCTKKIKMYLLKFESYQFMTSFLNVHSWF